jgi:hypothetical protein
VAGQEEAAERVEMATKVGVTVTVDEARSTKAGWRIIKKTKMHYQHKLLAVYIYIAPPLEFTKNKRWRPSARLVWTCFADCASTSQRLKAPSWALDFF